jgi:hypothetical protein
LESFKLQKIKICQHLFIPPLVAHTDLSTAAPCESGHGLCLVTFLMWEIEEGLLCEGEQDLGFLEK